MEVIADVEVLPHQRLFIESKAKHPAIVGGLGSGKSQGGLLKGMDLKSKCDNHKLAVYAPTYGLLRDIWFEKFEEFCQTYNLMYKLNRGDKIMTIQGFGTVLFRSMDDPASIIGYEVHDSIVDELDTLKPAKAKLVWDRILARNRLKKSDGTHNIVAAMTTPEGFGFTYEKWKRKPTKSYEIFHAKTIDNVYLDPEYYEGLLESYDPQLAIAYLDGQFVNLTAGQIYHQFNKDKHHHKEELKIDPVLDICLCVDFNVDPMIWSISQYRSRQDIRVVAEIKLSNTDTWAMCAEVKARLKTLGVDPKKFKAVIYGDAAGSSRDTRSTYSDYSIIEEEFGNYFRELEYRVPRANPPVRTRNLCVNNRLSKDAIRISGSVIELVDDFVQMVYKDNGDVDKSDMKRTHASDGFGYFVVWEFPVVVKSKTQEVRTL